MNEWLHSPSRELLPKAGFIVDISRNIGCGGSGKGRGRGGGSRLTRSQCDHKIPETSCGILYGVHNYYSFRPRGSPPMTQRQAKPAGFFLLESFQFVPPQAHVCCWYLQLATCRASEWASEQERVSKLVKWWFELSCRRL